MPGSRFWVCALNALQNSMMLRPRCPNAGPIGGEGFAFPAGTCSLIIPTIFFAMVSDLLDLRDDAVERGERPVGDAHLLADLEDDRRLRTLDPLLDLAHDPRRLVVADRRRPAPPAEEAGDLGGVLDEMPGLVAE